MDGIERADPGRLDLRGGVQNGRVDCQQREAGDRPSSALSRGLALASSNAQYLNLGERA